MTATNTVLQYVLSPTSAQANSRANFTLVATNGATALNLTPNDEIYLGFPVGPGDTDLTPDLGDINPQAPANWRCSKNPAGGTYNFTISPTTNVSIAANASLLFEFNAVIINPKQGTVSVPLQEFIGSGSATTAFTVSKSTAVLSIVAQAIPQMVGRNQTTLLKWTAVKAAYVTISPLPGTYDIVGQQLTTPSKDVAAGAAQVTYSLTAWTPDQQFARDIVVVTISEPKVRSFEPAHSPPINEDDHVTLNWKVDYAETVMLTLPDGAVRVASSGSLEVQPKSMLPTNGGVAVYTLRATGLGAPVYASISIPFVPVAISYFRYPGFGVTDTYQVAVTNGNAEVVQYHGEQGDYYVLTATGPFGPLTQYLGNYPALQIQVFVATATQVAPNTPVTLQWQTRLAQAMNLLVNGQSRAIAPDQVALGSLIVTPAVSTDYVLSASDAAGNIVTSLLTVVVEDSASSLSSSL